MPETREITICENAWKLHDAWMDALKERPADIGAIKKAKRDYYNHRDNCPLCTPVKVIPFDETD